jgi:hypothetical protein
MSRHYYSDGSASDYSSGSESDEFYSSDEDRSPSPPRKRETSHRAQPKERRPTEKKPKAPKATPKAPAAPRKKVTASRTPTQVNGQTVVYCNMCRARTPVIDTTFTQNKNGTPCIKGKCKICGKGVHANTALKQQ